LIVFINASLGESYHIGFLHIFKRSRLREAHRVAAAALTAFLSRLGARGAGVLSDHRERPRRGIPPDPLPDGESGEVQEGETLLGLRKNFGPVFCGHELL
jgi:hypothetical protein